MSTEYIFFSGKGGVGKTSMACTTAVRYADEGKRTLIVTTDPASNLADVFEQTIGHRIAPIDGVPNLHAMEIDPDAATSEYREQEDVFMRFIKEACEIGSVHKIGSSDLYKHYTDWCDLMGLTAEPQAWLTGKIREAGYRVGTSGGKATFWGITVKNSMSE